MRDNVAERLLAEVMHWGPDDVSQERPILQALATFKYDEYQQYFPGMRFIESLAIWLSQFEDDAERKLAYQLVRSRLIFISDSEMRHLVAVTYPDFIRPVLIRKTATMLGIQDHFVSRIVSSLEFRVLQRRSLFFGLSDGAHIGTFRRSNPLISNEQVRQSHEIPETRANDMVIELVRDLGLMYGHEPHPNLRRFSTIFLLDDFSASGLSFLREDNGHFKGKIAKVLEAIYSDHGDLRNAVDLRNMHLCVVLYSATTNAKNHISNELANCLEYYNSGSTHDVLVIQEIPESCCIGADGDEAIIDLLKKYSDDEIVDRHFSIGHHTRSYLGYNESALPLVLSHNTPNNSLPLLWLDETRKYQGLFPRVSRHK